MSSKAQARAAIYNRLASAPTFHPSNVSLFTDGTLQGGDIVTVQSGNTSYQMPVFSMNYKWNGASKVDVSNSGNEYRDSLEDMAQKIATRRGNGYRSSVRAAEQNQIWGNEFYSEDGALHSVIVQTTTYIMTAVENVASDLHSFILQTPEMIHAEVGSAVSGFAHSVIEQTATYIRTEVSNAASAISQTVIEQTTDFVRTEVSSVASGIAWSVVEQTMTGIITEVGRKSRVFIQMTDPVTTGEDVHEKDIWVKSNSIRTWNGLAGSNWNSRAIYKWREYYGAKLFVRNNGAWEEISDSSTAVEQEIKIVHNENEYALLGRKVDIQGQEYNSRLRVTAQEIRTDVSTAGSNLYSVVYQTATNVFSGVYNRVEGNFSTIEQTASQIQTAVTSTKSELHSSITQQANRISLVVEGTGSNAHIKAAQIVTSINTQDQSSRILLSADTIDIDGDTIVDWLYGEDLVVGSLEAGDITCGGQFTLDINAPIVGADGGTSAYNCGDIIVDASVSNNTLTLTRLDGSTVNFSKATSLSGAWGSGVFTASASPQGNSLTTSLTVGAATRSGRTVTMPIYATIGSSATVYNTGKTASTTITAGKGDISAQRGSRNPNEPSADGTLAKCSLNGWYIITVSVLGGSKTFKFQVDV